MNEKTRSFSLDPLYRCASAARPRNYRYRPLTGESAASACLIRLGCTIEITPALSSFVQDRRPEAINLRLVCTSYQKPSPRLMVLYKEGKACVCKDRAKAH